MSFSWSFLVLLLLAFPVSTGAVARLRTQTELGTELLALTDKTGKSSGHHAQHKTDQAQKGNEGDDKDADDVVPAEPHGTCRKLQEEEKQREEKQCSAVGDQCEWVPKFTCTNKPEKKRMSSEEREKQNQKMAKLIEELKVFISCKYKTCLLSCTQKWAYTSEHNVTIHHTCVHLISQRFANTRKFMKAGYHIATTDAPTC